MSITSILKVPQPLPIVKIVELHSHLSLFSLAITKFQHFLLHLSLAKSL